MREAEMWVQVKQDQPNDYNVFRRKKIWGKQFLCPQIIGITRIRNESIIIEDTLQHVAQFVDAVIAYDDCSNDETIAIVKNQSIVKEIIIGKRWYSDRVSEETRHRQILLEHARQYNPKWILYFDADERFDFTRRAIADLPDTVDGVKVDFYDAYMTPEDKEPYKKGMTLWNFRNKFGPEKREILVLFRNKDYIEFQGLDAREPTGCKRVIHSNNCQHYGKSLSAEQWEETCEYYSRFFPEPYHSKWEQRKGKAIHTQSDFGNPLYDWESVKENAITI